MTLHATRLTLAYGQHTIVDIPELRLERGKVSCLVGPNGCGKSTLLKALGGLLRPASGTVRLDERPLSDWEPKALARRLASLPQSPSAPDDISVRQLVGHGRYPHQDLLGGASAEDRAVVDWALSATSIAHLRERRFATLSGGERQRAWLAMTLAQQAEILLLDEPTTYMDMGHQVELLELLASLQRRHGLTVVMVLHDINQASQYADRVLAMYEGRILADGTPREVVDSHLTERLFGLRTERIDREIEGRRIPYCLPLPTNGANAH
ncbi:ABC transporter ATP-binding protein [Thiorhodococcus fuscus]|uniref:ABC transporter ATP-binding protein n=1 Tax=Thiorhodococcus fuscus TaxID=527200 RepID=A0ABW4Y3N2_9GAMM